MSGMKQNYKPCPGIKVTLSPEAYLNTPLLGRVVSLRDAKYHHVVIQACA